MVKILTWREVISCTLLESQDLTSRRKTTSYSLEVKALATKRLHQYLMGIQFDLVTDCSAFKHTAMKKYVPREVVQWLM